MKVAGIDVPKKVLMAVVVDCEYAGRETSATAIRHHAERTAPAVDMVAGAGSRRGSDGIDGPVLAVSMAGTRVPHAFAFGTGPSPRELRRR